MDSEVEVDNDYKSLCVPEFVQTWHPSVRRPDTLPHPSTYHECIEPRAIFELLENPSGEYIRVVPHRCTFCSSINQACSRLPPCARCSKAAHTCTASREGYQGLPPPKVRKQRKRALTPATPRLSRSTTSPNPEPLPKRRKRTSTKSFGQPGPPLEPKGDVDINSSSQNTPSRDAAGITNTSASISTAPSWIPVRPGKTRCPDDVAPLSTAYIVDPPRTPRLWANSRAAIAAVFPELTKSITGISWQRFDMPMLFLEHPCVGDCWKDVNTLEINREWSYKCCPEALEGGNLLDDSHAVRVESGSVDNFHANSSSLPRSIVDLEGSTLGLAPSPSSTLPPVWPPFTVIRPDTPAVPPSVNPTIQPLQLPIQKPPEIETLGQCRESNIPLLVFVSHGSRLLPQPLPAEYECVCLGFFFVSKLNVEEVGKTTSTMTHIMGRVQWRITLEWAPGGEHGLLEDPNVRSYPWWIDPAECPVAGSVKMPYRPRDLNDQYYSFLPLDLLADFKPSEFFPRGWYCKKCGMLNAQLFFRHQICQSSRCKLNLERGKTTSDPNVLIGHIDPLLALRDPQHSLPIDNPLDVMPSSLGKTIDSWDDGMRTLTYEITEGVRTKHIFTGNQEILQEDATRLLHAVQEDVIISRNDPHSPYFTWSTISGSEQTYTGNAEIPRPILDAQEVLLRYLQGYGGIEDSNISHIQIQAWATPGSKRGNLFEATSQTITVLCLGAEVVMNLVPKRGFGEISIKSNDDPTKANERILSASQPMDKENGRSLETVGPAAVIDMPNSDVPYNQTNCELGATSQTNPRGYDARDASGPTTSEGNSKTVQRRCAREKTSGKALLELSLRLVHGDAAILEGDDFECQIKRSGTTILLIGHGSLSRI